MLEFIYTSAPQTLDGPGYGPVAKSDRFPSDLEKFIRKLCRYEFLSKQVGPAEFHPQVYSHSIFRQPPDKWHVFSRIEFAGLDYTQRYVFLANHVALTASELSQIHVTALLRLPHLFRSSWSESPQVLRERGLGTPPPVVPSTKSHWAEVAGDSNWARVWAQRWQASRNEPRFMIFPGEANPLELYLESLETLSSDEADQTTFITHLASDHRGPSYEWIGLVAETELANSIERNSKERVLNLSIPLGSATRMLQELDRIDANRNEALVRQKPVPRLAEEDPTSPEYVPEEYRQPQWSVNRVVTGTDNSDEFGSGYRLQQSTPKTSGKMRRPREASLPKVPTVRPPDLSQRSIYLAIAAFLGVLCIGLFILLNRNSNEPPEEPAKSSSTDTIEGGSDSRKSGSVQGTAGPAAPGPDASGRESPGPEPSGLAGTRTSETRGQVMPALGASIVGAAARQEPVELLRFVSCGLRETWKNSKDKPGKLIDAVDELKRPGLHVSLVSCLGLKAAVTTLQTSDGRSGEAMIDVKVTGPSQSGDALHLQIGEGAVWLRVPSTNSEKGSVELMDRLRFGVLDIQSSFNDVRPFSLQLAFNSPLPSVPTNGIVGTVGSFEAKGDDLHDLFRIVHSDPPGLAGCFLRVNRISLSILPDSHWGWTFTEPAIKSDFKTALNRDIRLTISDADVVGSFKFQTNFDRGEASKPAVAAEMTFTAQNETAETQSTLGAHAKTNTLTDKNAHSNDEKHEPPDNEKSTRNEKSNQKLKQSKEKTKENPKSNPAIRKVDSKTANDGTSESAKDSSSATDESAALIDGLPRIPDRPFLNELFRRFGRVHAEFVVRIPRSVSDDGTELKGQDLNVTAQNMSREIIILRFGE